MRQPALTLPPEWSHATLPPDLKLAVIRAILTHIGNYVSVRSLCWRSSIRNVPAKVLAEIMRELTVPQEDAAHVGFYRELQFRTCVFYKCPPDRIKEEALDKFGLSYKDYCAYYFGESKAKVENAYLRRIQESDPYCSLQQANSEGLL